MAHEYRTLEKKEEVHIIQTTKKTASRKEMEEEKNEMSKLNAKFAEIVKKLRKSYDQKEHFKVLNDKTIQTLSEEIELKYKNQLEKIKKEKQEKCNEQAEIKSENKSLKVEAKHLREKLQKMEVQENELQNKIASFIAEKEVMQTQLEVLRKKTRDLNENLKKASTQNIEITYQLEQLQDDLALKNDVHKAAINKLQAEILHLKRAPDFKETCQEEYGKMIQDLSIENEKMLEKIITDLERKHAEEIERLKSRDVLDAGKERNQKLIAQLREYEIQIKELKNKNRELEFKLDEVGKKLEHEETIYKDEITVQRSKIRCLNSSKLSLQLQIATYRALVEEAEDRMSMKSVATALGYRSNNESALASALAETGVFNIPPPSGVVKIVELETNGKYIKLEDLTEPSKGAPDMKNWNLTQTFGNGKSYTHTFTGDNVFGSGKIVKIWGSKHGAGQDGITSSNVAEWQTKAIPSKITLVDEKGKEIDKLDIN